MAEYLERWRKPFFVSSAADFEREKSAFELATGTHFTAFKTSVTFGRTDVRASRFRIRWGDGCLGDHPYIILKAVRYECHLGPDHYKSRKRKVQSEEDDKKMCNRPKPTKKLDCPAWISAKEILMLTDYNITGCSKWNRDAISKKIKDELGKDEITIGCERRIIVRLPLKEEHNHLEGVMGNMSSRMDPRIRAKVVEYAEDGIVSESDIRVRLKHFVQSELFAEGPTPPPYNHRFFPKREDIWGIVHAVSKRKSAARRRQNSLAARLAEWRQELPADSFHLEPDESAAGGAYSSVLGFFSLFVYQAQWQRRLLARYGGVRCSLSAAHRTSASPSPALLFLVCVKTNAGPVVVGAFALRDGNSKSIAAALRVLRDWNPMWNPAYFVVEDCQDQIQALEETFSDCRVILCDFHREEAWAKWLRTADHGLRCDSSDILRLLKRIAQATPQEAHDAVLTILKCSSYWKASKAFRDWIMNTWLARAEKWARVYQEDQFCVEMSNSNDTECQNGTLKYEILSRCSDKNPTRMLTKLIKELLPDMIRRYIESNMTAVSAHNSSLPAILQHRPRDFVLHCTDRLPTAQECQVHSEPNDSGHIRVHSPTEARQDYEVLLGSENKAPECLCSDWAATHWPCSHMLAVILHHPHRDWTDFPDWFREHPLFTLDTECTSDPDSLTDEGALHCAAASGKIGLAAVVRKELDKIASLSYQDVPLHALSETLDALRQIGDRLGRSLPGTAQQDNTPTFPDPTPIPVKLERP